MTVTYFVAKYADDPLRMEPKNIGVIAIVDGRVYARFIGESEDESNVDLRKVRGHVRHTGAYKQWIEYWRYLLSGGQSSESIVNELLATPRLNYFISDASTMGIDGPADSHEILDYLFHLLVSAFPEQKNEELSLSQRCDEILGEYRLRQNPHFIALTDAHTLGEEFLSERAIRDAVVREIEICLSMNLENAKALRDLITRQVEAIESGKAALAIGESPATAPDKQKGIEDGK
jgi:hypothetical protein